MKKRYVVSHTAVAVAAFIICLALTAPVVQRTTWFVNLSESFKEKDPTGHVDITIFRADGTIEYYSTHNLVTTIGKTRVRNHLIGNSSDPTNSTDDISLSNDATPSAAWTILPGEMLANGLERADGALTVVNVTAFQVVNAFTSSADSQTVQCSGLHWAVTSNSTGNLFAAATYTQVTLNTNDQIQITWTVNLQ